MSDPAFNTTRVENTTLEVKLDGDWVLQKPAPDSTQLTGTIPNDITQLIINGKGIASWDTRLLLFLNDIDSFAESRKITIRPEGLPAGALRLLQLAHQQKTVQRKKDAGPTSFVYKVGKLTLSLAEGAKSTATFTGEVVLESLRLFAGKSPMRLRDFLYFVQSCGVESLPIVSLISVLVGVILSFVGAIQLQMFGAEIYIANLVGLGMVLEMGALMSGVIISGRIGAAFAAQLGTMQANEEIDALQTMGISPIGFLVLPRMFALLVMMPILCMYADLMSILGGPLIGVTVLDLSLVDFFKQTVTSINLYHCFQGISKSAVFGLLIGFAGCLRGIQCGRSALAVGEATTSAVVTSIVLIVISDSILTIIYNVL